MPQKNDILETKLEVLTRGINVDTVSLQEILGNDLDKGFKCNTLKVSDRHFISPHANKRNSIPDEIILHGKEFDSIAKVYYSPTSDIQLTAKDGRVVIKKRDEIIQDDISLAKLPNFIINGRRDGIKDIDKFLSIIGKDKISIVPYDGCYLWKEGHPCKFCGGNPKRIGINEDISAFNLYSETEWETRKSNLFSSLEIAIRYMKKYDLPLSPHTHLMFIAGNLQDLDFMWQIVNEIIEKVSNMIDIHNTDSYVTLMPPHKTALLEETKKLGIKQVMFNLEVYGEVVFKEVCPGKEKQYGYKNMIKTLEEAVDIFGFGKARTNMVLGVQRIDDLLNGAQDLARKGIVVDYSIFFPRPGSIWAQKKPPNKKDVLYFTKELVKIYNEYSLLPYGCTLSSRSSVINEVFRLI
ncbi:MAG: hypothetical protein J7K73_02665 [Nanoarchaeota archaeon]|nr:hypothetical protein [Nanoarchaeota archaeon]